MKEKGIITREEVAKIIEEFNIEMGDFIIRPDGLLDVNGDVNISSTDLEKLPLKFGVVCGNFWCSSNKLTTLENAPYMVSGDFNCYGNNLSTLEQAPLYVGGFFSCHENNLKDLNGCPREIKGNFNCFLNELTSLVGGPNKVKGSYYANHNELRSLDGSPDYVGGSFYVSANDLINLVGCPKEIGNTFSFDYTVGSLHMGDQDCKVKRIYIQQQENIPTTEKILPEIIMENQKNLPIVFRYMHAIQDIFSSDGSFDEEHFALLILDIEEGFE